jgi:hypothetical protein
MRAAIELSLLLGLAAASPAACTRPAPAAQQQAVASAQPPPVQTAKRYDGPLSGNERIAWVQQVGAGTKVSEFTFVVYVDGTRKPLPSAECRPLQGSRHHACEAPLPALPAGRHTLRFAAVRTVDGHEKASALSEPLIVVRAPASGSS